MVGCERRTKAVAVEEAPGSTGMVNPFWLPKFGDMEGAGQESCKKASRGSI